MIKGFDTDSHLTREVITEALAAGDRAAGRYLKNLTPDEVQLCKELGFGLWLIDEKMGDWAYFQNTSGHAAGTAAAQAALALGAPAGSWIANAVDFDASATQIPVIDSFMLAYEKGLDELGMKLLVYGSGLVETEALPEGAKAYLACAGGWAGTRSYPKQTAALVQHLPATKYGLDVDPCDIQDESIIWWPAGAKPQENEAQVVPPTEVPFVMPKLSDMQRATFTNPDGLWGPLTARALANYYLVNPG